VLILAGDLADPLSVVRLLAAEPEGEDGIALEDACGWPQYLAGRYRLGSLRDALSLLEDPRDVSVRRLMRPLTVRLIPAPVAATQDLDTATLLPRPLEPRQGRALHPRGELHRFLLVEGLRQGRHHHLGGPADRLPVHRPGPPEYEPRGCPRGAAFSWYTYSPTRVRYPYVRGVLLDMYRAAKADHVGDPVVAWAAVVSTIRQAPRLPERARQGRPRAGSWDEVVEMIAARTSHRQALRPRPDLRLLPDPGDVDGVHASAPLPQLIGGTDAQSFYDWYADLPVASPQVFGDQTDVPESGDWWDAGYLIMWGSNVPMTRTPTPTG
jgi:hypothetical protein